MSDFLVFFINIEKGLLDMGCIIIEMLNEFMWCRIFFLYWVDDEKVLRLGFSDIYKIMLIYLMYI